ncbi:hypothetical protein R5R35_004233 [Gryllus longicercus]|uniref:Uncharacterized protein n=1 Tax=Gryllus longicercus TaxID=2509291 RepID=A0AAN9WPH9_9ORTH
MAWATVVCGGLVLALALAGGASAWPRAASWADGAEGGAAAAAGDFQLRLLHTNDMHARFDETNAASGDCNEELRAKGKCYGGFARVARVVKDARKEAADGGPATLFLNAGDTYQGTVWFTVHKHRIVTAMLNRLAPDAISLGNHEFDDGVAGLAPFLRDAQFPVLAANINVSAEPSLQQPKLKPIAEFTLGGHKVGVIGYVTPETVNISFTGKVQFEDEVTAIRREARHLKAHDVHIIIALGHSGYDVDLRIAEEVEDVDVVVGGHTNTFLYSGDPPDSENATDLYPTVVTQASGRKVPVVQAYAYTKYMGRLNLVFNNQGELRSFDGNPLLLNASIEEDADMKRELETWRPAVEARTKEVAGRSDVLLEGDYRKCRTQECTLGNLVADAYVMHHARRLPPAEGAWTDAAVALQHGGGLRADVDGRLGPAHNVTVGALLLALPFENRMFRCEVEGGRLRQALEWGVWRYDPMRVVNPGAFLQLSGLRVTYDLRREAGRRVAEALVLCARCAVPDWQPLQDDASYGVMLPFFLLQGGDGFGMLHDAYHNGSCVDQNYTDLDVVIEHFRKRSPVMTYIDGRIAFDPPVEVVADAMKTTGGATTSIPSFAIGLFVIVALVVNTASRSL